METFAVVQYFSNCTVKLLLVGLVKYAVFYPQLLVDQEYASFASATKYL